ncbi:enoyl-CoA hydratase [alpha proteobacterium U9-1i]|nr:enoyl-CoA hydratase [alpha proteobacterium U9-1i]
MSKVKYALDAGVAVVTMSDPGTLNAIDEEMIVGVSDAFERAASEARCIVLTGEGRGFCSGAKLSGGAPHRDEDGRIDAGKPLETHYNPLLLRIRDLPIPFVTAVNGIAAGAGASFALMGDLIVASENAYFLQAFRRIGLVPDAGATYVLPRMVGRARAMELTLLGEKLPARTALEWGMVNRLVPDSELLANASALALELANGPTRTLGLIRKLIWDSLDNDLPTQLRAEREAQKHAGHTADFVEGVSAFLQKRPAQFKGA